MSRRGRRIGRHGRRRTAALLLLTALTVGAVPTLAPSAAPATAQETQDAAQEPDRAGVTLAAIDPVVTAGGAAAWSIVIEHRADGPWEQVEVVAELHRALGSRSALRAALAGGAVPPVAQRVIVPSASARPLPPGGVVRISGAVPLTGPAFSGPGSAVHPLRLRVVADGEEVGSIDTAVVLVGTEASTRLATTLVWPVDAPPARGPDGETSAVLDPLTRTGGRIDTLLDAIDGVLTADATDPVAVLGPAFALTVPAHLLEDLEQRGAGIPTAVVEDLLDGPPPADPGEVDPAALRAALLLQRLRVTARALPAGPLVTPYGDADIEAILASGAPVRPLAGRAVLEGVGRLPALLGRQPSPVVLLDAPVGPATLDLLPTRTVIVPHAAIDAPDLALDVPLGDPVRAVRGATGRFVTALVGDPYLTSALGASTRALPGDPVRAAHEVLVRTAMIHLESPGRAGRALVLLPPPGFDPDPRFAAELLARLAAAPWLEPTSAATIATARRETTEPALLREGATSALPSRLLTALSTTERDLRLLVGSLDPDADLVEDLPIGPRRLTDASDELLRATSRAFADDLDAALALLAGVRRGVDSAFGTVTLAVNDVTMTDRDGTVPMTLAHADGVPLLVRVELTGPAALTWTDGRVREVALGTGEQRSIEVPVRSGATGRFPVTVRVTDPSGERLLASDVVGVRATAVAGPALLAIAATVLVLVVVGTLRQRRRGLALRRTAGPRDDLGDGTAGADVDADVDADGMGR